MPRRDQMCQDPTRLLFKTPICTHPAQRGTPPPGGVEDPPKISKGIPPNFGVSRQNPYPSSGREPPGVWPWTPLGGLLTLKKKACPWVSPQKKSGRLTPATMPPRPWTRELQSRMWRNIAARPMAAARARGVRCWWFSVLAKSTALAAPKAEAVWVGGWRRKMQPRKMGD